VIAALMLALVPCAAEPYHWPLDLPRQLTSSFAEYRTGRFHAGIDLRTGPIGKTVYAAAAGHVSRVRCSPWGYGKAVYLSLDDGRTVVYAHLNAFLAPLDEYVRLAQHENESYTVDLYPEPGRFKVTKGQAIAKSGQTGVGVPHLHYEIRDGSNRPINPRLLGITWPDSTAPRLSKVVVMPEGPGSTVNGDIRPVILTPQRAPDGTYACAEVRATGRIGFGLDVVDPANNGATKLGVYTVRTEATGEEVFSIRNDYISYDNRHNGTVAWHPHLLDKGRFLVQWRWPGNVCDAYGVSAEDGWYAVSDVAGSVTMTATDFLGNAEAVTVPVRQDTAAEPGAPAPGELGHGTVSLECYGAWLVVSAAFTQSEPEPPVLHVSGPQSVEGGAFRRVDATTFRAGYRPAGGATHVGLRVEHPRVKPFETTLAVFRRGDAARTVDLGDVRLAASKDSPYGVMFARPEEPGLTSAPKIRQVGATYRIWPDATPIDEPVELALPIPPGVGDTRRLHVYRAGSSYWYCEGGERRGDRMVVSTRRFGTYALMEDDKPPEIRRVAVGGEGGVTTPRPPMRARVTDIGSGLTDITVTCGGQWMLMEHDPEQGSIEWVRDEDLPAGKQEIRFRATDRAGNVTTVSRTIQVPKRI
jgi:Peptidase family M23